MPPVHQSTELQQYLSFYLAEEEYAIGILQGTGKVGKKFVLLLDVHRVLAASELQAVEAMAADAPEGHEPLAEVVECR